MMVAVVHCIPLVQLTATAIGSRAAPAVSGGPDELKIKIEELKHEWLKVVKGGSKEKQQALFAILVDLHEPVEEEYLVQVVGGDEAEKAAKAVEVVDLFEDPEKLTVEFIERNPRTSEIFAHPPTEAFETWNLRKNKEKQAAIQKS